MLMEYKQDLYQTRGKYVNFFPKNFSKICASNILILIIIFWRSAFERAPLTEGIKTIVLNAIDSGKSV